MALSDLKKTLGKKAMKAMSSPQAMQLMSDPRFQKVMMDALQMQATARKRWRSTTDTLARQLNLATSKEMTRLQRQVRDLEKKLKSLEKTE